jgi:hypothetical protein
MHGVPPAVLVSLFLCLGGFTSAIAFHMDQNEQRRPWLLSNFSNFNILNSNRDYLWSWMPLISLLLAHCVVTLCVNAFYVSQVLVGLPDVELVFLQISLSIFKLSWNQLFVGWAMKSLNLTAHNLSRYLFFVHDSLHLSR